MMPGMPGNGGVGLWMNRETRISCPLDESCVTEWICHCNAGVQGMSITGFSRALDHQALTRAAFQSGCPQSSWYEGWRDSVSYRAVSKRDVPYALLPFLPISPPRGGRPVWWYLFPLNSWHWAGGRLGVAFQNNHSVPVNPVLYSLSACWPNAP